MDEQLIKDEKKTPSVTIKNIEFNEGTKISLDPDDIVVFVGANNVGKSRALKDIIADITESTTQNVIINKIEYNVENFECESMKNFFATHFTKDQNNHYNVQMSDVSSHCYSDENFKNIDETSKYFYRVLFTFLSTESRLDITKPIRLNYSIDRYNFNIMNILETNKEAITLLNRFLLLGFNKAVEIDNKLQNGDFIKKYKIGNEQEIKDIIELDKRSSAKKLKMLENLNEQGDGIRSAVAVLASLIVNEHSLYLIDEPETFLHPPQARLLGKNIVELSKNKQCFISTHNIDLIRGLLEKGSSRIKIVKIDRMDNTNKFHILDNESITKIANDKNLKYSNILNGLFYKQVVLCENESDCKFYSVILEHLDSNTYQNTLFCAVGGKDQFKLIIPLLKKLGINYLIVADIDLINDKTKLKQLINSIENDEYNKIASLHNDFLNEFQEKSDSLIKKQATIKQEIEEIFNTDEYMSTEAAEKIKAILKKINSLKLLKEGGKFILPAGECTIKFNQIQQFLKENSIYIVECGEIERFIPEIDMHGNSWVEAVFEKYKDLNDSKYNSVKDFIKEIFKIPN